MATKQEVAIASLGLAALQKKGFAPTFCQHEKYKDGSRIVIEQQGAAPNVVIEVFPLPRVASIGTEITRQYIRGVKEVSPTENGMQIIAEYKGRRGIVEVIPNEGIIYTEETIPRPAFVPPPAPADVVISPTPKGTDGYEQLQLTKEETKEAPKVQLRGFVGNRPYYNPGKKDKKEGVKRPEFHFTFYVHPNPADPQESLSYNVHASYNRATSFAQKKLKVGQEITIIGFLKEEEVQTPKGTHLTRHLNAVAIITDDKPQKEPSSEKRVSTRRRAPPS
jgi:hypothetical protein